MKLNDIVVSNLEDSLSFDRKLTCKHWTVKYRNSLPDSSFAAIEPAYAKGTVQDKRCRHLPYKDAEGKIDESHLQNALSRVNSIKPFSDSITASDLRGIAMVSLQKAKKEVGW